MALDKLSVLYPGLNGRVSIHSRAVLPGENIPVHEHDLDEASEVTGLEVVGRGAEDWCLRPSLQDIFSGSTFPVCTVNLWQRLLDRTSVLGLWVSHAVSRLLCSPSVLRVAAH